MRGERGQNMQREIFTFTDRDVHKISQKHNGNGLTPGPIPMPETCRTPFLQECWTVWFNLAQTMKKDLRKKQKKLLPPLLLEAMFFFHFDGESFSLSIDPMVVGILQLPAKIELKTKNPWEFFGKIMIDHMVDHLLSH